MIQFLVLLYRTQRPLVNYTLIAVSVVVFLYELTLGGSGRDTFFFKYGVIPRELTTGKELAHLVVFGAASPIHPWATVFTSMFVHGSLLHLVGNMLFLWGFGGRLEEKLGHVKYLVFYVAAGVAAVWTQVAIDMDSTAPLIGASGAISGVVGAYLLTFHYPNTIWLVVIFFVLPIIIGLGSMGPVDIGTQVAYMAHLGGLAGGALMISGYKLLRGESLLPPTRWRPGQYRR